jgi:hypothetical protein
VTVHRRIIHILIFTMIVRNIILFSLFGRAEIDSLASYVSRYSLMGTLKIRQIVRCLKK